jgi:hypothetical protein
MPYDIQSKHEFPGVVLPDELAPGHTLGSRPEFASAVLEERHREVDRIMEVLVRDYYRGTGG